MSSEEAVTTRKSGRKRTPTKYIHSVNNPPDHSAFAIKLILAATHGLSYRTVMQGQDREEWNTASAEEFTRLVEGWKAMRFIPWSEKPEHACIDDILETSAELED